MLEVTVTLVFFTSVFPKKQQGRCTALWRFDTVLIECTMQWNLCGYTRHDLSCISRFNEHKPSTHQDDLFPIGRNTDRKIGASITFPNPYLIMYFIVTKTETIHQPFLCDRVTEERSVQSQGVCGSEFCSQRRRRRALPRALLDERKIKG